MPTETRKKIKCAYMERGRRCQRAANGNPPLCEAHRLVLEDQVRGDSRGGDAISSILSDLITGRRVSEDRWKGGIEEFARLFQQAPSDSWVGARRDRVRESVRARVERVTRRNPEGQRQPPPPPPPRKPSGPNPRVVLGFTPSEVLTPEIVKRRHRELARKHHPDHGGSVERMQQINAAADALLATMG